MLQKAHFKVLAGWYLFLKDSTVTHLLMKSLNSADHISGCLSLGGGFLEKEESRLDCAHWSVSAKSELDRQQHKCDQRFCQP